MKNSYITPSTEIIEMVSEKIFASSGEETKASYSIESAGIEDLNW